MFITTPGNLVYAIDATSGDLLWRYQHDLPETYIAFHRTNRGVALYGDKVYTATLDARVVALDATTGRKVWDSTVQDNNFGYYITMAPLAIDGKILVGTSGGELGIRGFIVALDAETGEEVWRTYTVPAPGEPGNETWPGESGAPAGQQFGCRATMMPSSVSPISAPATPDRGSEIRDRETISIPTRCWRWISRQEKSGRTISTTGTAHGIGTRFLRLSSCRLSARAS